MGHGATVPAGGPGVIFDMSVGYDLAGISHPRMTRFMDTMADASAQLAPIRETIAREFPQFADIEHSRHDRQQRDVVDDARLPAG